MVAVNARIFDIQVWRAHVGLSSRTNKREVPLPDVLRGVIWAFHLLRCASHIFWSPGRPRLKGSDEIKDSMPQLNPSGRGVLWNPPL